MSYIAILLLLWVALFGLVALVRPANLIDLAKRMNSRGGLAFAAGFRIVLGIALWFSAAGSAHPEFIRVLAVIMVVAGLLIPFIGVKRFGRMLTWFASLGALVHRFWGAVALAFGVWLITVIGW